MRTFGQLKTDIGERIRDTSTPRLEKIGKYVNYAYNRYWNQNLWVDSIVFDTSVQVTASQEILVIPCEIQQILAITNREINCVLTGYSPIVFQRQFLSNLNGTGSVYGYSLAGSRGIKEQLSSASAIKVSSSDDDDVIDVHIVGKDANGNKIKEEITLNGTVEVTGTKTFTSIDYVSKEQDSVGTITFKDTSDNVLERIDYDKTCNRYLLCRLGNTSDGAINLYVTGKKGFVPLEDDNDCPSIPISDALFHAGLAEILRQTGEYTQAAEEEALASAAIVEIISAEEIMGNTSMRMQPEIYKNSDDCSIYDY